MLPLIILLLSVTIFRFCNKLHLIPTIMLLIWAEVAFLIYMAGLMGSKEHIFVSFINARLRLRNKWQSTEKKQNFQSQSACPKS